MNRTQIARRLLLECPPDSLSDYQVIAEQLETGLSKEEILFMPEVFRWPKTYKWLRDRL